VRDVLQCALHYDLIDYLRQSIEDGVATAHREGLLSDEEVTMHL